MRRQEPGRTYACAAQGLPAALQFGLLGGYDGASSWTLALAGGSVEEQFVVEVHEFAHHQLQLISGWGLISTMALLLSRRGFRRYALDDVFEVMVGGARATHEIYATHMSATTQGAAAGRALLARNPQYLAYLNRGLALVDAADARNWRFHDAAISAVLEVCMRPAAVFNLLGAGFGVLRRADLDLGLNGPDGRLAVFEQAGGAASWGHVFAELLEQHADMCGDWPAEHQPAPPIGSADFERLRQFTEEILGPRLQAHVGAVLDANGMPSISSREQSRLAMSLKSAVADVDPALAGQIQLTTERLPLAEETVELARQRIQLRDPLSVDVIDGAETVRNPAAFRSAGVDGSHHVLGLWLDREVVRRQFAFGDRAEIPDPVAALAAAQGRPGARRMRMGLLPAGLSAPDCQKLLGDLPLLVLTSHLTLARHQGVLEMLQSCTPVFVLMDLPVLRHVGHWVSNGVTVRIEIPALDAGLPAGLAVVTMAVNLNHPFIFILIASEASVYTLLEQLRGRYGAQVRLGADVLGEHAAGCRLVVRHVMDLWQLLGQGGAS